MSINFGAALSQFGMPYLRTNYGYQYAFLFPAGLMALALLIFALGKRFYAREVIERKVVGAPGEVIPDSTTLTGIVVKYKVVTAEEKAADRAMKLRVLGRIGSVFLMVMAFWAIFDQSASTWIFFADTYMDTTIFGVPTSADAIQAFNPVFIVLLVPVSVWLFKTLDKMGYKVQATHKMTLGFALTGLSMVIMSVAGFLAGQKHDVVKLTTPEGSVILSKPSVELDKVEKPASGSTPITFDGVQIAASDWEYDKEKKKLSFAVGAVTLKGGQELPIAKGHLPTSNLPTETALTTGGVLEPMLKSASDLASVKPDETKATLEMVEWVKPTERVTVWWQVLAFLIITVAEILISVTGLELAFVAAPQSMKSFVTACWLAVVFLANLLINAPITRLYPHMAPGVYFAGLAGAMAVVTLIFIPVGIRFNRGMAQAAVEAEEKAAREGNTEAV
jgi:dipeptide/tripeptide permease